MINKRMIKLVESLSESGITKKILCSVYVSARNERLYTKYSLNLAVSEAVRHGRACGILPTNWLAWMLIKIAVESWLRRYFNRLWNDVYGVPSRPGKLTWGMLPELSTILSAGTPVSGHLCEVCGEPAATSRQDQFTEVDDDGYPYPILRGPKTWLCHRHFVNYGDMTPDTIKPLKGKK